MLLRSLTVALVVACASGSASTPERDAGARDARADAPSDAAVDAARVRLDASDDAPCNPRDCICGCTGCGGARADCERACAQENVQAWFNCVATCYGADAAATCACEVSTCLMPQRDGSM